MRKSKNHRSSRISRLLSKLGIWSEPRSVPVESSVIKEISYDRKRQALRVLFNSGKTYIYGCVEPRTAKEFVAADSKGRFFNRQVRNNSAYPYRLVEDEESVAV